MVPPMTQGAQGGGGSGGSGGNGATGGSSVRDSGTSRRALQSRPDDRDLPPLRATPGGAGVASGTGSAASVNGGNGAGSSGSPGAEARPGELRAAARPMIARVQAVIAPGAARSPRELRTARGTTPTAESSAAPARATSARTTSAPSIGDARGEADRSRPYRHEPEARRLLRRLAGLLRPLARWSLIGCTWLLAGFAVCYVAGLRFLGESWWVTAVALYLPHWVLLGPIGAMAIAAVAFGPRRLLFLHAGAALIVLFPVMGVALGGAVDGTAGSPRLRVVSYNVGSGARSIPGIVAQIKYLEPDLVLLQESNPEVNAAVAAGFPGYQTLASTQFFYVSRGALSALYEPPKIALPGADGAAVDRSPRFVRATVETALGPLDVYNIHPISPREALTSIHGDSFLGSLRTGDHHIITENTLLRRLQAEAIVALAATSPRPVLLAGDTNLPQSSRILAGTLGRWRDGFDEVGRGLGYTFPVTRRGPWMRIDRIFADDKLRFLQFGTGESAASDHHCVWAELERSAP